MVAERDRHGRRVLRGARARHRVPRPNHLLEWHRAIVVEHHGVEHHGGRRAADPRERSRRDQRCRLRHLAHLLVEPDGEPRRRSGRALDLVHDRWHDHAPGRRHQPHAHARHRRPHDRQRRGHGHDRLGHGGPAGRGRPRWRSDLDQQLGEPDGRRHAGRQQRRLARRRRHDEPHAHARGHGLHEHRRRDRQRRHLRHALALEDR